uniref:Uncharacterized protein n=1 Tax=Arundo donax TaxID=35708 RepID=A0A0A8YIU9_ARUDO
MPWDAGDYLGDRCPAWWILHLDQAAGLLVRHRHRLRPIDRDFERVRGSYAVNFHARSRISKEEQEGCKLGGKLLVAAQKKPATRATRRRHRHTEKST